VAEKEVEHLIKGTSKKIDLKIVVEFPVLQATATRLTPAQKKQVLSVKELLSIPENKILRDIASTTHFYVNGTSTKMLYSDAIARELTGVDWRPFNKKIKLATGAYAGVFNGDCTPRIGTKKLFLWFEIKSAMAGYGHLLGQLKEYLKYTKHGRNHWFVVCPYDEHRPRIEEEGFNFIKAPPEYGLWRYSDVRFDDFVDLIRQQTLHMLPMHNDPGRENNMGSSVRVGADEGY
jgi:hypothetical protein